MSAMMFLQETRLSCLNRMPFSEMTRGRGAQITPENVPISTCGKSDGAVRPGAAGEGGC